jgi:hypothetical protein
MPGNDYGVGEAIQTFMQMRQFMDQQHAARQQALHAQQGGQQLIVGSGGGVGPYARPGGPMGLASLPGAQPMPQGGMPRGPQRPGGVAPMGSQMPGPSAPSGPAALGGGGQPAPPSSNIASIMAALSSLGGGQQPPQAPPRDPGMSGVAAPTGSQSGDADATMQAIATNIIRANPGIKPADLWAVVQDKITAMKGLAPEMRYALGQQANDARRYASDNSLQGREYGADRGLEGRRYSADVGLEGREYGADAGLEGREYGADAGLEGRRYTADTTVKTTGMRGKTAERVAGISAGARRYSADKGVEGKRYTADHPRPTASKYDRNAEVAKTTRTLIASGVPAAEAARQAEDAVSNNGQGSASYPDLKSLVAAQKAGKIPHDEAVKVARAKGWVS